MNDEPEVWLAYPFDDAVATPDVAVPPNQCVKCCDGVTVGPVSGAGASVLYRCRGCGLLYELTTGPLE